MTHASRIAESQGSGLRQRTTRMRMLLCLCVLSLGCSGPEPAAEPAEAPRVTELIPDPILIPPAVPTPPVEPEVTPPTPAPVTAAPHVDRELQLLSPDAPACIEMVSTCDAHGMCTSMPVYIDCGTVRRVGDEDLRCNCDPR